MSNATTYGTYTLSTNGMLVGGSLSGERPEPTPKGLIVTRAVQTRDGWRGQVIVDKEIIHETSPIAGEGASDQAMYEVNGYVVERIKRLFSPDEPSDPTIA